VVDQSSEYLLHAGTADIAVKSKRSINSDDQDCTKDKSEWTLEHDFDTLMAKHIVDFPHLESLAIATLFSLENLIQQISDTRLRIPTVRLTTGDIALQDLNNLHAATGIIHLDVEIIATYYAPPLQYEDYIARPVIQLESVTFFRLHACDMWDPVLDYIGVMLKALKLAPHAVIHLDIDTCTPSMSLSITEFIRRLESPSELRLNVPLQTGDILGICINELLSCRRVTIHVLHFLGISDYITDGRKVSLRKDCGLDLFHTETIEQLMEVLDPNRSDAFFQVEWISAASDAAAELVSRDLIVLNKVE
jgi:hypothetical protein